MIRKLISAFGIGLWLATFFTTVAQAGKAYSAERFDVQLDLLPGGDMIVTETVVFRFEGGPFTYAFRHISAERTDGLTFLEASMDGIPMMQGTGAGQVEVQAGNPLKVTWHFAPTGDSTHTFIVRYRVAGVVSTGQADTLRWYVIPPDHGYPIDQSTVWLNYPPTVQPLETPSLDRSFKAIPADTGFKLTTRSVGADAGVILTAKFPPNSLVRVAPGWQLREQETAAATARTLPMGLFSALATLLLGGLGLFLYIRADRRELNLSEMTLLPSPPDDRLPPAVVGKLIGQESYSAMGAIFDLAQRGVMQIREEKGWFGAKKFNVELTDRNISLHPHEQGMLQAIFKPGQTQVNLSDIFTRLSSKKSSFYEPLEQELLQRGWLDPERKRTRTKLITLGLLSMFVGMGTFIGAIIATNIFLTANQILAWIAASVTGLSGGVFVLSISLMIYAGMYSLLTPAGEEQKIRWKSFRNYLNQVCRGREPAIRPDLFERYLAYAAVFGLGEAWAKYFQKLGGVPLPVWLWALDGSNDFGAMVAVMSAADTSAASGGAGGAAGASGGGSSGAG